MTAPAAAQLAEPASSAAALALRLAQRAFAAYIEDAAKEGTHGSAFRAAQLRGTARRTLSALSADDRPKLSRWLILQFAASVASDSTLAGRRLARVDVRLAANIGAAVAHAREELRARTDAAA
jgi:hypothetical protein